MAYSGLTLGKFNPYFHQHSPSPVWSGVTSSDALGHSKPGNLLPPWKLTQQNFVISTSCSYFSEISTSTRVQILYSPCCLHLGYSPRYEADTFKFAMSEWGVWARGLCDAERSQSPVTQPSLRAIGLISCWISSCILHQICACAFHNQTSLFFFFFQALEVAIYGVASPLQIRNQYRAQNRCCWELSPSEHREWMEIWYVGDMVCGDFDIQLNFVTTTTFADSCDLTQALS